MNATETPSGSSLDSLVLRVEEERKLCLERMSVYRQRDMEHQYDFTNGQRDAFAGVLLWIQETQNDKGQR
jgi:hypothetical protein